DVPRAGINVSEGTWGGHLIEYNDVFNTVLGSSDHGAFNSWGRDRFWHPNRKTMDKIMEDNPEMPYWDAIHTTVIRNNRMRCDHGWDIDLDDGSSNYHLYNNLCLNGGIKLREGFYRTVENNIMVNNGFHPHVWFKNSGDVFARNILMTGHQDIRLQAWGKEVDHNLFPSQETLEKAQQNDTDKHSLYGDPLFIDPQQADFKVHDNSPALKIGFKNFPMDRFGIQNPELKRMAKTPEIPALIFPADSENSNRTAEWLGATLKNIENMGERSAAGLKEISGVLILKVKEGSLAAKGGIQEGDVVISCEGKEVKTISNLLNCNQGNNWKGVLKIRIVRNQNKEDLLLKLK
ncbi:MAG: PDZ domain-containing protein, partial [Cyclobacteriaceae bacterium]|nr:PDZ domain-containing protein [Cyclobacteriaceae bacterium]